MNPLFALVLLLTQTEAAPPKPWHGTLAQGLAEVRRLSEADKTDEALAVAEQLLVPNGFARWRERATENPGWKKTIVETAGPVFGAVGLTDLSPAERAAVQFARGVALARAEKRAESDEAFEKARALAGPGDLRLDATYDLGWTALEEGEKLRAKIPELNGGAAAAPPAATPAGPDPTAPDPLDLARAAYQKARERFVGSLKANAKDGDARANVELAQKRLRELAEIQKKREEEKKKQDQQKKDDQKKDDQKKDQDKKDQDKQDPDKKDSSSDDKDKKKPDEQPKDDKPKDDKDKKDQPKDDESDKDKKEKKQAQPQPSQEQQLTKEEVMRLLDTLKDREEEGRKLLEQLRRARRAKVKRDW